MPALKKLINQMEHNDPYIIKINNIIQQDKQTEHLFRGLRNHIDFEAIHKEYKLVTKADNFTTPHSHLYRFTITKNDEEFIKGTISPLNTIKKFRVTFAYDFEKDLVELNDDIVQLFKDAI